MCPSSILPNIVCDIMSSNDCLEIFFVTKYIYRERDTSIIIIIILMLLLLLVVPQSHPFSLFLVVHFVHELDALLNVRLELLERSLY